MNQELEQLLKSQYTNPVDSSGSFSLHAEKALEKIAKYQLPYPDAWVVKLGQGVVLSGADSLKIHQSSTDTTFVFYPREKPDVELSSSFLDPSDSNIEWWQYFRGALWAVGINLKRPFKIGLFGENYFWDGFELHNLESRASRWADGISLDVSHRTVEQGKGLPVIRNIQAAWLNAGLSNVFSEVLFSCPLAVTVDGRNIDGFQRVPNHGFSSENHPVKMFWVKGEPPLPIPPSTRDNRGRFMGQSKLEGLTEFFESRPPAEPIRAAALLSAHAYYQSGKNGGWRTPERKSVIYWIRHGVVIQKEEFHITPRCVSLAVFASCDHIATDITGFGLEEETKQKTMAAICQDIDRQYDLAEMDIELHNKEHQSMYYKIAGGVAASGLVLKFIFPPAVFLTAAGGYGAILISQNIAKVDGRVNRALRDLKDEWRMVVRGM